MLLLEALTSWTVVYAVIALPAVMLGANFVFGDCTVAAMIEGRADEDEQEDVVSSSSAAADATAGRFDSKYRASLRRGRLTMLFFYGALLWQYHVHVVVVPLRRGVPESGDLCALPVRFLAAVATTFLGPHESADETSFAGWARERCTTSDYAYHAVLCMCLVFHASAVLQAPRRRSNAHRSHSSRCTQSSTTEDWCWQCRIGPPFDTASSREPFELDHHCHFIHGCVARGHNFGSFLAVVALSGALAFWVLLSDGATACEEVSRLLATMVSFEVPLATIFHHALTATELLAGAFFAAITVVAAAALLLWQLFLFSCTKRGRPLPARPHTTASFIRTWRKRQQASPSEDCWRRFWSCASGADDARARSKKR